MITDWSGKVISQSLNSKSEVWYGLLHCILRLYLNSGVINPKYLGSEREPIRGIRK